MVRGAESLDSAGKPEGDSVYSSNVDAVITGIYELLIDSLEEKLRSDAPSAVRWFERLTHPVEYFSAHPGVWPRKLGSFDAAEREILSGLFDVRLGLDSVRYLSEQALEADDLRQFHMATLLIPVAISALLQRLDHLAKRARRSGIADAAVGQRMLTAVARFRERDAYLGARDAAAHGSFVKKKSWTSAPESDRLWEAVALQSGPREPLDSMLRGQIDPRYPGETRKRLSNVESVTSYTLTLLLNALRGTREFSR